jgi:hypothetical protein
MDDRTDDSDRFYAEVMMQKAIMDADEQAYLENIIARFEADNADIGCEFDN